MQKGQMNYLDIILHGYYNNSPEYLSQHFVRECKNAETENYPADEFFTGCAVVIEKWETDLQQQVIAGKAPIYDKLALARTRKVVFDEKQWKDTPPENRLNEVIESCKQELKAISAHDYRVDLPQWARDKYNHEQLTYSEILQIKEALKKAVKSNIDQCPPQPSPKSKSEFSKKLISFSSPDTIIKLHGALKGCFPDKEMELLKALQGEQLAERLVFPYNQNRLVEVFRRLKYNGYLLDTDTETRDWICSTFLFIKKGVSEPQQFNRDTVWNNLNKGKGEPNKKARICIDWLPYKSPSQLGREKESEKL